MTVFYAQPYDISASGFYFSGMDEYDTKYSKCRNDFGAQVEEFEIQFIDGETIDAELFKALGIHQGDISYFLEAIDEWEECMRSTQPYRIIFVSVLRWNQLAVVATR